MENLSNAAIGLWVKAGAYCAAHNTYGQLSKVAVKHLGGTLRQAQALVDAGLWEETETGWRFHQWRKNQDGNYRRNIPQRIRTAVMERDNYTCVECGSQDQLSLDHIIPYRHDGPDTEENLRVLCMPCNNKRFQAERRNFYAVDEAGR